MSDIINVTSESSPVIVQMVVSSEPVNVAVSTAPGTLAITVALPAAQPVSVAAEMITQSVIVEVGQGSPGAPGPPGANAEIVVLSLAAYLALSPAAQMNGTWYVIPKA
jgi:hypothetical protein